MKSPDEFDIAGLQRHEWHGYLTAANAEAVAERIRLTFKEKLFTYVTTWRTDNEPDVRVSQMIQSVKVNLNNRVGAAVTISDTYGLWFIESDLADRAAANEIWADSGELGKAAHWIKFDGERLNLRYWGLAQEQFIYVKAYPEHPEYLADYTWKPGSDA